jgi:hypothetical protein
MKSGILKKLGPSVKLKNYVCNDKFYLKKCINMNYYLSHSEPLQPNGNDES